MLGTTTVGRLWLALILLLALPGWAAAYSVVVIDAGHGGRDPGTRWHGLMERNLTLDVAKRVETILKGAGIPTVMTRRTDVTMSLDERVAIANRRRNALLVSIHFNAHRIQGISGYETFYRSARGKQMALTMQKAIGQKIRGKDRGVTNHPYAVLTRTKGPALLIECGFISNAAEADRIKTAAHRQALALGIANGIIRCRRL